MGRHDAGGARADAEATRIALLIESTSIEVKGNMKQTATDSCKQDPGVFGPVVSLQRCEGKGDCERVCPEDVFRVQRVEDDDYRALNVLHKLKLRVHGMQVAYTPNIEACRGCGLCVAACPEHAITLQRRR
jgi:NAD-dependent dihydropyrimidine dehydrogenase PreA subunit